MIRAEFLSTTERAELTGLARNGLVEHRLARRANALVLLDWGMSCAEVSAVFLLDDDTVRRWFRLYREGGIEGLSGFSYEGSACNLSIEQQERLKAWIVETLPRTTRHIGAWIEQEFSITYQSRSGLAQPGRRIKLQFVPAYCPHLNPVERLWGLMHKNVTHNRCYATFPETGNEFCTAMLGFLKEDVPRNWRDLCDNVSDNFRIISPKNFRVLK